METKNNSTEGEKPQIKINKKMRLWNKYRHYTITAIVVVAVLIIVTITYTSIQNNDQKQLAGTQQETTQNADTSIADTSQQDSTSQQTTTASSTTAASTAGTIYQVPGKASTQEFTSQDFYSGAAFIGDAIASGISYYGYLSDSQVFADENLLSDKADSEVESLIATNPSKVFIMIGTNDLNYGSRGVDEVVSNITEIITKVQTSLPSAQVYVISVFPITQAFESKSTVQIKQSSINLLNEKLSMQVISMQATYIDAATAFQDDAGYMNTSYTANGTNIYNQYYPFLLNGIAGVAQ